MIKFNGIEKIIEKLQIILSFNNQGKKITNKNSPNYGTQIAANTVHLTDLAHKTNADIRKLEIIKTNERAYSVKATYVDGTVDDTFPAHWYGWQLVPRGPLWTPLGQSSSIDLGKSRFSEISAWVYEQADEQNVSRNVHHSIGVRDKPW